MRAVGLIFFEMPLNKMAKNTDFMRSLGITEQDIKEDAELIFNECNYSQLR